jgi:protein transport protein SEC23
VEHAALTGVQEGNGAPARVLMFVGGPATVGPGQVASLSLREIMRSHAEVEKARHATAPAGAGWAHACGQGEAAYVKTAMKHYQALSQRCVAASIAVDVFSACLDQARARQRRGLVAVADACAADRHVRDARDGGAHGRRHGPQ